MWQWIATHIVGTLEFVMITRAEVWLTYADWGLCIVVLATGTWRFITDIVRGDQ